jgi:hypothetical protein
MVRRTGLMPGPRSQIAYVFGYASLVEMREPLVCGGVTYFAVLGQIRGFRRFWGAAMNNWEAAPSRKHFVDPQTRRPPHIRVAFLDVEEQAGAAVNGLAVPADAARLADLDVREVNYLRVDISYAFEPPLPHPVFAYRGTPEARARRRADSSNAEICVSSEYLARVRRGFAALGPSSLAEFERTTDPLSFPTRNLELVQPGPAPDSFGSA